MTGGGFEKDDIAAEQASENGAQMPLNLSISLHFLQNSEHTGTMTFQRKLLLKTRDNGDMCDLTQKVAAIVSESQIQIGIVNIFNVGSTGAIGTIEIEPGLVEDLPTTLNRLVPADSQYSHQQSANHENGHSHLQATFMGPDLTVPIQDGKLMLGTWQHIFHLECDIKPRLRDIIVTVYGEQEESQV